MVRSRRESRIAFCGFWLHTKKKKKTDVQNARAERKCTCRLQRFGVAPFGSQTQARVTSRRARLLRLSAQTKGESALTSLEVNRERRERATGSRQSENGRTQHTRPAATQNKPTHRTQRRSALKKMSSASAHTPGGSPGLLRELLSDANYNHHFNRQGAAPSAQKRTPTRRTYFFRELSPHESGLLRS
jgi:hypothetical protein